MKRFRLADPFTTGPTSAPRNRYLVSAGHHRFGASRVPLPGTVCCEHLAQEQFSAVPFCQLHQMHPGCAIAAGCVSHRRRILIDDC